MFLKFPFQPWRFCDWEPGYSQGGDTFFKPPLGKMVRRLREAL